MRVLTGERRPLQNGYGILYRHRNMDERARGNRTDDANARLLGVRLGDRAQPSVTRSRGVRMGGVRITHDPTATQR
jgi:hypothetical protein